MSHRLVFNKYEASKLARAVERRKIRLTPTFSLPDNLRPYGKVDKNKISIVFYATPDRLVVLAAMAVNKISLPSVQKWTYDDVMRWMIHLGFDQYKPAIRRNFIDGRRLLFVDSNALVKMNIKDFDHIKTITSAIRKLHCFENIKYRYKSLPPYKNYEYYRLNSLRTGSSYEGIKPSIFFWKYYFLHEIPKTMTHWDRLTHWVLRRPPVEEKTVIPGLPRFNLYKCKQPVVPPVIEEKIICTCTPPCTCDWPPETLASPRVLSCLDDHQEQDNFLKLPYKLNTTFPKRNKMKYIEEHIASLAFSPSTNSRININPGRREMSLPDFKRVNREHNENFEFVRDSLEIAGKKKKVNINMERNSIEYANSSSSEPSNVLTVQEVTISPVSNERLKLARDSFTISTSRMLKRKSKR